MANQLHRSLRSLGLFAGMVAMVMSTGCVNQYTRSFVPADESDAGVTKASIMPASGKPRLVTTENSREDGRRFRENGYILLGRSKFRSSPVNEKEALSQARKLGAELVMVRHEYVTSVSHSVPALQYIPGQIVQTMDQTVVKNGDKPPKVIDHQSTSFTNGEYHTTYVEESTDYFDYSATYWAKARSLSFGVHVKELDQETRADLGTNKGVMVRLVVKGTPAYDADLLQGDILRTLAGEEITDADRFFALVRKYEGQKVPVVLYRSGHTLTKQVSIGNE